MNNKSLLIIDDDPKMLDLIIHYIEKEDFDVMVALNGMDGFQLAESEQPSLILLDIAMPGKDGFETCHILKNSSKTHNIPIIFMTASSSIEEKVRGFEAGAVDYVTKPFQYQELLVRIKTHLQIQQLRLELLNNNRQLKIEIEHRREAEQKADEARIEAEQANQAKSTFLAMMSESLRLPLNTILGYSSLLQQEKKLPRHYYEWLGFIQTGGKLLLGQVNDILDVSLLGKNKLILRTQPIELHHFLNDIAKNIENQARKKNLQFIFEKDQQLPAVVQADKKRLGQILSHLLDNAIKFTEKGWVSLKVKVNKNGQKSLFRFEIEDSGIGIAESNKEAIFKLFHTAKREEPSDKTVGRPGLGLGLSLTQHLLKQMDSEINLQSKQTNGSLFWFDLDLPIAKLVRELNEPEQQVTTYQGAQENPRSVVIFDDIVEDCFLLRDYLEPLGFQVTMFNNIGLLKQYCQSQTPDIIFVELYGDDVVKQQEIEKLKKQQALQHVPLVGSSSNSLYLENKQKRFSSLFNDVLIKPIDRNKLLTCIKQQLFLQWDYESEDNSNGKQPQNYLQHVPAQQKLRALYGLVQSGEIKQINAWADRVGFLDPSYLPFTDQIKKMALNSDLDEILVLLEELL